MITWSTLDLARVRMEANSSELRRARLCAHPELDDAVHEMLICMLEDIAEPLAALWQMDGFDLTESACASHMVPGVGE